MSQQPKWVTDEGTLGTVPEGEFYKINLLALDPDFPLDPLNISYSLLAGDLPDGIAVQHNGTVAGIPLAVSENITSKFTVRALTDQNRISDRTFSITVTGQNTPEFTTPTGLIGEYYDGIKMAFQIEFEDDDPDDIHTMRLVGGELPPGLVITENGLIHGYIEPIFETLEPQEQIELLDVAINKNFEFTLEVSDRKELSLRTFIISVFSRAGISADSTVHTADSTFITVDIEPYGVPYLITYEPFFGKIRHDNFYAYEFKGFAPQGGNITYKVVDGTLPENLILDPDTGWMYGYLSDVNLTEVDYEFKIQLSIQPDLNEEPVLSFPYTFYFTVVGEIETNITWLTDNYLGEIYNGAISTFVIEAQHDITALKYRFNTKFPNRLPQGLSLQTNGEIVGRVSFKTFVLDNGKTTFNDDPETTFDSTYEFYGEAYSDDGFISVTKKFKIIVDMITNEPYNVLYARALPPVTDRDIVNNLVTDTNIMDPAILYRPNDPNFGVSEGVVYPHIYGLRPASLQEYFAAFNINHYYKTVTLGEIKTARALDDKDNILYEVVYSEIIDDLVNQDGESVAKKVDLSANAINHGVGGAIDEIINVVYPNSFDNMRKQVVDKIGQISKVLPRWMLSKQENDSILGFTPAWVIAYTKPGQSNLMSYRIETEYRDHLNRVDFTIDRFTIDRSLSKDWELCDSPNFFITADAITETVDQIIRTTDQQDPNCTYSGNISKLTLDTVEESIDSIEISADNTTIECESPTVDTIIFTGDTIDLMADGYNSACDTDDCSLTIDSIDDSIDSTVSSVDGYNITCDNNQCYSKCSVGWKTGKMTTFDRYTPSESYFNKITKRFTGMTFINNKSFITNGNISIRSPDGTVTETTFDHGTVRFISPVDTVYTALTDSYDKYVPLPQIDIVDYNSIRVE